MYEPGSFGFHELVDRSCLIAELFSGDIANHPAAKHPRLKKRIKKLESMLFALYTKASLIHADVDWEDTGDQK